MASAEKGDIVRFYVDGATATPLAIASETSVTLDYDIDEIDTTAKGDTARTGMVGHHKITGSVEGLYVHSDDAQQRLITQIEAGSQITVRYYRSGVEYKNGTAQLTNLSLTWSDNEAATYSAAIAFDGGLTAV
jgi:predicted secreted protein